MGFPRLALAAVLALALGAQGGAAAATRPATIHLLDREGKLAAASRDVSAGDVLRGALAALLRGPTPAERRAGLATAVPAGTRLARVELARGVATVRLSPRPSRMRLAQVVYTVTALPGVRAVRFPGLPGGALTRRAYAGLEPEIFLERPTRAAAVTSPQPVRVTARGRLTALLLDRDGDLLAKRSFPAGHEQTRRTLTFSLRFDGVRGPGRLVLLAVAGREVAELELPLVVRSGA